MYSTSMFADDFDKVNPFLRNFTDNDGKFHFNRGLMCSDTVCNRFVSCCAHDLYPSETFFFFSIYLCIKHFCFMNMGFSGFQHQSRCQNMRCDEGYSKKKNRWKVRVNCVKMTKSLAD